MYGVGFTDANNGTAVGSGGTILRTTNGGTTWTFQESGTSATFYGVSFSDRNTGTVVGWVILRTTNGGVTFVNHTSSEIPESFSLYQNYPNPFNPVTIITFRLQSKAFVSLKVFDTLGREISNLLSKELPSGPYSQQWNATGFPSGVYFYRLQAGSFVETKKLVLLR